MSQSLEQIFNRLSEPFAETSIEWVVTFTYGDNYEQVMIGVAPYIKRESIMTRLDVVCGPAGWGNEIQGHGTVGIFQSIWIKDPETSEKIIKWDGAEMNQKDSSIDKVKTVTTQSFRRTAELFGIGRYLKDMPQMFAVKRPENDYNAAEKTKVNRKINGQNVSFTVRWDHPDIPAEYLPEFMTPEQFVALKGLKKYYSGEFADTLQAYIDTWEGDHNSIAYSDAAEKIQAIRAKVNERMGKISKTNIYVRGGDQPKPNPKAQPTKSPTKPSGPPPTEPSAPAKPSPPAKQKQANGPSEYGKLFLQVRDHVAWCLTNDPEGTITDPKFLNDLKAELIQAQQTGKKILEHHLTQHMEKLSEWKQTLEQNDDDDLPF